MGKVEIWLLVYLVIFGVVVAFFKSIFDPNRPHVGVIVCVVLGPMFGIIALYISCSGFKDGNVPVELVVFSFSAVVVPVVLLKMYWGQMNANREFELREKGNEG